MSNYVVSARKYRPSTFDEVVGQDHIAKTLKNAIQNDKLAHAFLFCGPRGVGKTTSARILAKVINCENPQNEGIDPCNECSSCKSFNDNASFNIIELDAASNNSVEHIRTLIEQVRFKPQQGQYKIFIIDEVHMLSSQAFNAFLKTLEEPPPYAIFILATTEKHKILPTILSRCQIFDFKRIMAQDIVLQLEEINQKEGRTADKEALYLIGQKADGAMRDALSIYDKIASAAGANIGYKDVVTNLNILDYDYYFKITDTLLTKDLGQAYIVLDEIIRQGFEPDQIIQGLAEHFRNLLVSKDPRTLVLLEGGEKLIVRYKNQANSSSRSFLLSGLSLLNDTNIAMPRANNKRLYLEICLGKINHVQDLLSVDYIEEKKTKVRTASNPKTPSSDDKIALQEQSNEPTHHIQETSESKENKNLGQTNEPLKNKDPEKDKKPTAEAAKINKEENGSSISMLEEKIVNTPEFSSFKSLISKIKREEEDKKEARKNLSLEAIEEIWAEHTQIIPSKRVQTTLNLAIKSLTDHTLTIWIPNAMSREIILQETALMEKMRNQLGIDDLILNVNIDIEKFPGWEEIETKKVMTNKEKYEIMLSKNPALADLRRVFDLKVDKS
jgi:DNA polymerase-3 subunit gamma/tau